MIHLIMGGARSGKSRYGENLALSYFQNQNIECHYIATAEALDDEMKQRINHHQTQRNESEIPWILHEKPLNLHNSLVEIAAPNRLILVDCLTLWLTNELLFQQNKNTAINVFADQKTKLLKTLKSISGTIILVSNEVGSGIVPLGNLSRQFVDEAGWLNQDIAQIAHKVTLVVAGLPLELKG